MACISSECGRLKEDRLDSAEALTERAREEHPCFPSPSLCEGKSYRRGRDSRQIPFSPAGKKNRSSCDSRSRRPRQRKQRGQRKRAHGSLGDERDSYCVREISLVQAAYWNGSYWRSGRGLLPPVQPRHFNLNGYD